jgi:hypothetical protein
MNPSLYHNFLDIYIYYSDLIESDGSEQAQVWICSQQGSFYMSFFPYQNNIQFARSPCRMRGGHLNGVAVAPAKRMPQRDSFFTKLHAYEFVLDELICISYIDAPH